MVATENILSVGLLADEIGAPTVKAVIDAAKALQIPPVQTIDRRPYFNAADKTRIDAYIRGRKHPNG